MLTIFGAGMAGLLAAQIMRRHSPHVREAQRELPDNHGALLRFRTDAITRETGVPLDRVRVLKGVMRAGRVRNEATLTDANEYSLKVTGELMTRSIMDLSPVERWVARAGFLGELAKGTAIIYNDPFTAHELHHVDAGGPIISTIPMPMLMDLVGWDTRPEFRFQPIWSVTARISYAKARVYQTIYYPDPAVCYYRASITGDRLIVEYNREPQVDECQGHMLDVMADFGMVGARTRPDWGVEDFSVKHQKYGKLLPIDERARRAFILAMTDKYNIYSVGRFATWRQILLDDVVSDVKVVQSFIEERDAYGRALASRSR